MVMDLFTFIFCYGAADLLIIVTSINFFFQILERIIEIMKSGRDCQNVICARYDKVNSSLLSCAFHIRYGHWCNHK